MERVKHHWKRVPSPVRKPVIFVIGFVIVASGIAMLVLPGPGAAAIFLGLALLATEFALAAKVRDWSIQKVKSGIARIKHKHK